MSMDGVVTPSRQAGRYPSAGCPRPSAGSNHGNTPAGRSAARMALRCRCRNWRTSPCTSVSCRRCDRRWIRCANCSRCCAIRRSCRRVELLVTADTAIIAGSFVLANADCAIHEPAEDEAAFAKCGARERYRGCSRVAGPGRCLQRFPQRCPATGRARDTPRCAAPTRSG